MGQRNISNNTHVSNRLDQGENGYENFVEQNASGENSLSVLVSGVQCAGCIQKIESSLSKEQDIQSVRLNFSTKRLFITWSGVTKRADDFVHTIEKLGYGVSPYAPDKEQEQVKAQVRFLLVCMGVAGFAMGNIMLLSVGLWTSTSAEMGIATRDFMHWISAAIAIPAIMFAGRPFFRSAFKALKAGHTNMDVPISLALILASGMSLYETINHGEHVYFDSSVMLMFFLLIGRYLDYRARGAAHASATELLSTFTGFANVIDGQNTKRILIRDIKEGMNIRIASGEKFPVDGKITEGITTIDTSLVTGETLPKEARSGDKAFAGTMNISAPVTIIVEKAAENSLLADIVRLMEKATQGQAKYVRIADKAAKLYTPVVHSMALIAFLGWWLIGGIGVQESIMIAVTVLIITCPCALGLAVPVVQILATTTMMKKHILVKSGDALERLADIDTALMDKTGTITIGKPVLQPPYDEDVLKIAASLAVHSHHPLSQAIVNAHKGELYNCADVNEIAGQGLQGVWNGKTVRLGSRAWISPAFSDEARDIELWLDIEGSAEAKCFYFKDRLRDDSIEIISKLQSEGINVIMLSGDQESIVKDVAEQCGIKTYYAQISPIEKFNLMEELKAKGHKIMMIGDGLNDAPTLAGADISIAPSTAIDMAQNSADVIFMGDKFSPVYDVYKTAKQTQKLVSQNFILAVMYNMIAIPLAIAGMVTPLIAAIAMSGSSLIVIGNSFRLRLSS